MFQVNEQQRKYISGAKANKSVDTMLDELISRMGFNISVNRNYADGYPDMEKQFKMDYCVIFHDFNDKHWLLKTTSSIRERIYGTEFFAQNIRIIDSDENKIEKIYVVVPDSISEVERTNARRYSDKINGDTYKSFLSDVVTISKLRELIMEKCMADISQGVRSNIIGKDAEDRVAQLLNDEGNWQLWNNFELHKHEIKSDTFHWFKAIMSGIGADPSFGYTESVDKIAKIVGTCDIPGLEGGGYPKTDVSFTVTFSYGEKRTHNITIKKTSEKRVTVHEGTASDLVKALQLNENELLALALSAFQDYGSEKQLRESPQADLADVLYNELPKYNRPLVEYALFGVGNPRTTLSIQVADCILFKNDPDKDCFWLRDAYVDYYLKTFVKKGQFGTPFQWTYPSKKRGVSFQLKGFTNN